LVETGCNGIDCLFNIFVGDEDFERFIMQMNFVFHEKSVTSCKFNKKHVKKLPKHDKLSTGGVKCSFS